MGRAVSQRPPSPTSAPKPPPRDPSVRRARARAALPPGSEAVFIEVGEASPYLMALVPIALGEGRDGALLALVDVTQKPGVLLGRHDFVSGPMTARKALVVHTMRGEPAILAELDGEKESMTCGWWLAEKRPRFLCAPKIAGESRYETYRDELVESWETEFPPAGLAEPTRTGRMLRLSPAGRWTEVDSFRCLGRPLAESLEEAGRHRLRRWQRDTVRRLSRVALHESRAFADERASRLLRDAVIVDACDAEPWRLLGRLEFQAGRMASAAPPLAAAVALDSHNPAPLVDLADALVALDVSTQGGAEAWALTCQLLARPPATRALVDGVTGPKVLARDLYKSYLERTEETAVRHHSRRRRVEGQLQVLQ